MAIQVALVGAGAFGIKLIYGAQVVASQKQSGLVSMRGHTRRFNPS